MMTENTSNIQWISLHEAAKRLGVHSATLRRWADTGEIQVMITPGGHRRFAAADLDRFAEERHRLRVVNGIEQVWAEQALTQARQEIDRHRADPWLSAFDEQDREHKRVLGRQLLDITLKYISLKEGGDDLLEQARAIGCEHAENALGMHLPLVEALRIVLFFRDTLFRVALHLPEVAHLKVEANTQLLLRMGQLLAAVELSVAATYDPAQGRPLPIS